VDGSIVNEGVKHMNRLNNFSDEARMAIAYAHEEAQRLCHRLVGPEHLLLGLLKVNAPLIDSLFAALNTSAGRIALAMDFVVGSGNRAILSKPSLSAKARVVLSLSEQEAVAEQASVVAIHHLLLGILTEADSLAVGVLESCEVYPDVVRQELETLTHKGYENLELAVRYQRLHDMTPTLNQVSRDLTLAALRDEIDPMIGREVELERTMQILCRRSKNNPVLIGPAGVGKTAIAEGLALRIIDGQVPENLLGNRVVSLDAGLLSAGTKFRGDFEERLKTIMHEIVSNPGIIMVIDELHTLVRTGVAEGSLDAANLFKPMLARGEFQCIGATTLDEYRKTVEADAALERRFQPVMVEETNAQETLQILEGLRTRYEEFHRVTINNEALVAAVQMSSRYITSRFQPDKAIDLIDEAAARVSVLRSIAPEAVQQLRDEIIKVEREKEHAIAHHDFAVATTFFKQERKLRQELGDAEHAWRSSIQQLPQVTPHDITGIVAIQTGIPVAQLSLEESQRLLHLEQELHQRVVGQDEAVRAVAQAVRRSRTNVGDCRRPIGSFLFAGPTGVGKTELARALAASLFGDENAMLKLDMSEFMESHSVSSLVGAPAGYVGYEDAGQLTEAVRRRPYSVVLFDEIEKAHAKVYDLLLQVLEDGRLTDARGREVDFRNTIIIITSNVGASQLTQGVMAFTPRQQSSQERQASKYQHLSEQIIPAVKALFRPELLNRIDETVVFHALEQEHLQEIADLMIAQTQQRLAEKRIDLHVSGAARLVLVKKGYDAEYGARPLRRTIQTLLEDMLAEALLQGLLVPGCQTCVDAEDDRLVMIVREMCEISPVTHIQAA
jgi:ATP-dependent Clp protease ATP-binding subunit ClpC